MVYAFTSTLVHIINDQCISQCQLLTMMISSKINSCFSTSGAVDQAFPSGIRAVLTKIVCRCWPPRRVGWHVATLPRTRWVSREPWGFYVQRNFSCSWVMTLTDSGGQHDREMAVLSSFQLVSYLGIGIWGQLLGPTPLTVWCVLLIGTFTSSQPGIQSWTPAIFGGR